MRNHLVQVQDTRRIEHEDKLAFAATGALGRTAFLYCLSLWHSVCPISDSDGISGYNGRADRIDCLQSEKMTMVLITNGKIYKEEGEVNW
jgi:hypothetical protein